MTTASHPRAGRTSALLAVSAGIFCIQLDAFALNPALPHIGADLRATAGGLQWVISAYLLTAGTLMAGAGRISDLFGRRRTLMAGMALFAAASTLCALAPTLPVLVAARIAQGAGGALFMPAGLALVTNAFPPGRRERALGAALGIAGVATACGPFVGGLLTETVSWRAVFWINVPFAVLCLLLARGAPSARGTGAPVRLDRPGLVTATAALASLAVYVDRGPAWGWASPPALGLLAVGSLLLLAFVRIERAVAHPLVDLALFRNGPYVALTAAGAVANAATVVFLFVVPLALQGTWGLPAGAAGAAFLAPAAAMAAAGPVAGRVGPARSVAVMAVCLGAAAAVLHAAPFAAATASFVAVATVGGAVLGLANALTLTATQAVVRPERAGEASGVTKSAITISAGLGVVMAGPAADPAAGPASEAAVDTALATAGTACLAAFAVLGGWTAIRRTAALVRGRAAQRAGGPGSHARRGHP